MPAIATVCGQTATPNPAYGCGVILDASNRSRHSSGLCRACDSVKQRMDRKARKNGKASAPAPAPARPPSPAAPAADGCDCELGKCKVGDNPARAPLTLIWSCRLAPERVATLQRFTQAQRQSLQVERESRDLDGGYVDIEVTRSQWDIAEQRIARLYQHIRTVLPPEWLELVDTEFTDFVRFWNSVTPVASNRNIGLPDDSRPVYRGAGD